MYNQQLNTDTFLQDEIKYCIKCGSAVMLQMPPDGDNHLRFVCTQCKHIHYQNPKIVVGSLSIYQNKILLCKRAIQPRYGYWTLPAGFMENGETTFNGAWRETFEETGAHINIQSIFAIINVIKVAQVHMFYLAEFNGEFKTHTTESLDVALFDIQDIPWQNLAFESVSIALKRYIEYIADKKMPKHTHASCLSYLPYHDNVHTQYK